LGQPVEAEFVRPAVVARPFSGRVDALPPQLAEPLLGRGMVALAGHPVLIAHDPVGAVHLYFAELEPAALDLVPEVLSVVAAAAREIYRSRVDSSSRQPAEEDDRTLFLAVAGHELRTPVTVLKGYASMLADRWDSLGEEERHASARVLTQRADELARLVDRLLGATVGDGAAGGLVRRVPFEPLEALLRAAGELPVELRRSLRVELPNSLPAALGDPAILGSIVTELVTNAVRANRGATPPPAEPLTVDLQAGADAHTVFVRVCDRGIGIDPIDAERAFERFWRASRGAEGRGGVGLGLYLVRRLVERQNGWVSLRPRDGGGTVAEVRLPRADRPLRSSASGKA
jgi:signal transduction histidine kinase